jgi:hypothetical protein
MSSHHFVKENQEPALLVLDTTGFSFEIVAPLLEWVPTVLVSQAEVWTVISWAIKVDVILADLDFQRANFHLLEEQYPVKFLGVKDENYLEEAFQYLVATKHAAVNIIGLAPWELGIIPHREPHIDFVLWKTGIRYFPIQDSKFKKWFRSGEIILYTSERAVFTLKSEGKISTEISLGETVIATQEGMLEIASNTPFWIGEKMIGG